MQKKLLVGSSADLLEYEADDAADAAVGGRMWQAGGASSPPLVEAPPAVGRVLRSPGQALDDGTRNWAEPAFGRDFSRVRVHRGPDAEQSAAGVQALAYTVGPSIVFGRNSARSGPEYRRLVAHELAHVIQQGEAAPLRQPEGADSGLNVPHLSDGAATVGSTMERASANVAPRPAAVGLLQRTPDTRGKDLGFIEEGLVTLAAAPSRVMGETVYGLMRATWHGFMAELDAGAGDAFDKAKSRAIDFIKSPKEIALFPFKYAWGLVKGVFSPITGLFDLAKLAYHLEEISRKLVVSAWEHSDQIVTSAGDLAAKMRNLGREAGGALKGFMDHPVESVKGMLPLLDGLGDQATGAAEEGGHKIGNILLGSVDHPIGELGETAGEVIGTVVVNVALFVLTDGIGDALLQIALRLGEVGKALSAGSKMAEVLGTILRFLGGAIGKVGIWIAKLEGLIAKAAGAVLKPLAPVLEKFGEMMGSLRTFLRDLFGVAERAEALEAEAAAAALAKKETQAPKPTPKKALPPPEEKPVPAASKPAPAKPAAKAAEHEPAPKTPAPPKKTAPTKPRSLPPEARTNPRSGPGPAPTPPAHGTPALPPRQPGQPPPLPAAAGGPRPTTAPRVRSTSGMTQAEIDAIPLIDDVGLTMRGLTPREAFRAYKDWIRQDPLREVGIYRSRSGEYMVVQGKDVSVGALKEVYEEGYVVLVEHYHPGADELARIASEADFEVMMHAWRNGQVPSGPTSTMVRWKDPVTGADKLTTIGYRPGRPEPYYIKFEELDGRIVERTFKYDPWIPGSDYKKFLYSRYRPGGAPPGLLPSPPLPAVPPVVVPPPPPPPRTGGVTVTPPRQGVLPPPSPVPPPRPRSVPVTPPRQTVLPAPSPVPRARSLATEPLSLPPAANAPVRPVRGSGPAPTVQTATGVRPELRTAQTGGIKRVKQARDAFGLETTSIDTEMQAGMNRAKAPNYNKLWSRSDLAEEVSRSYVQTRGMTQAQAKAEGEALANNYEAAHVVGPGFGDEAAAGMMWAPRDVNQKMQNGFAEKLARDFEKLVKPMGGTVETTVSVVPFEADVLRARGLPPNAKFLDHAEYKITVRRPNHPPGMVRITVTSQRPGPNAMGDLEFDPPELALRFLDHL